MLEYSLADIFDVLEEIGAQNWPLVFHLIALVGLQLQINAFS